MLAVGVPLGDVVTVMQVSINTLKKYYPREIATGKIEANAVVAQSLFQKAIGKEAGSITAAIFWLKCRAGWDDQAATRAASNVNESLAGGIIEVPATAEVDEWKKAAESFRQQVSKSSNVIDLESERINKPAKRAIKR